MIWRWGGRNIINTCKELSKQKSLRKRFQALEIKKKVRIVILIYIF